MKPTFESVTAKNCECGSLENAANNPDMPISFDPELNEYHLEYSVNYGEFQSQGITIIYHFFFCGGVASHSQRELLFKQISAAEKFRLQKLTEGLQSLDQVIARFGEPDRDMEGGFGTIESEFEGKPPRLEEYRTLVYLNLSETAEVKFVEFAPDRIHIALSGKAIAP